MKTINQLFVLAILCIGLPSCQNTIKENETPKSLQEKRISVYSSRSSDGNLVESLYQDLVEKSSDLKQLENDFDGYEKRRGAALDSFVNFDQKSKGYYSAALLYVGKFSDSSLKFKMRDMINESAKKYDTKTNQLQTLLKDISKNAETLNDHHNLLKILLTLPLIEKYQNQNLPKEQEYKQIIDHQAKLIDRTDKLVPKK